jgi:hypothetical protein
MLDRGANCTNHKYRITGTPGRVLSTTPSNGSGELSVTLTHYRHRILGRCIAYKGKRARERQLRILIDASSGSRPAANTRPTFLR